MSVLINIGKKLIGEGAGAYLPFALSKLRYFASTNPPIPFTRIITSDEAVITLELHTRTAGAVTIVSSGFTYEFTLPGDRFIKDTYAGTQTARGYGVKVRFNALKEDDYAKFVANPTGSNAEKSPSDAWKYENDVLALAKFAPHKQIWQIEHIPAHTYYASALSDPLDPNSPRKMDAKLTLADSWTSACQITGLNIHSRSGTMKFDNLGEDELFRIAKEFPPYDIIYDIGPTLYKKNAFPEKHRGLVPDSDWYKRGAMRVVESEQFGKRTFVIMTDITNRFYVYPIVEPDVTLADGTPYTSQLIKTNVPGKYVKVQDAPFPSWVRKPTQKARDWYLANPLESAPNKFTWRKQYLSKFPQYRWAFNSLGTRAATIGFNDFDYVVGRYNANEPPPPSSTKPGNVGQRIGQGSAGPNQFQWDIREAIPGMIEMELTITIDGPDPENFSFSLGLKSQINPAAEERYVFAVDYSWGPRPGEVSYGTAIDDLIIMEMDVYPCGEVYPVLRGDLSDPPIRTINERANIMVKNVTQSSVLKKFTHSRLKFYYGDDNIERTGFYSEEFKLRFHAIDLRVLGFITEGTYLRNVIEDRQTEYSAKRVQVSIYGKDEPYEWLSTDGTTNSKMGEFVDDVNSTGLLRLSPAMHMDLYEHTSNPAPPFLWTFTIGTDPLTRCMAYRFTGKFTEDGERQIIYHLSGSPGVDREDGLPRTVYSLGASRYATLMDETLLCGVHSAFTIHPEGHWAVTSPVIVHYDGVIRYLGGIEFSPIQVDSLKQTYVDIIAVNMQNKDFTYREVRTTHLKMFNKAYKKDINPVTIYWLKTVTGGKLRLYHPVDLSKYYEFQHDTALSFSTRLPPMDGLYSYVVRGSSIFFGRHHKEQPTT